MSSLWHKSNLSISVQCDGCRSNISSTWYRDLEARDLDLCSTCYFGVLCLSVCVRACECMGMSVLYVYIHTRVHTTDSHIMRVCMHTLMM